MNNLAPTILFVYNRLEHTRRTLEALKLNELASSTDLIIFSDGPKTTSEKTEVDELRKYLKKITGFKSITINERKENLGLAKSIVAGVSEVISQHGKVIVLEDDIVTSPFFLTFMNKALDHFENVERVWHISGWNYPIDNSDLDDVFFWRAMNCWGWATWDDRWSYFDKNPNRLISSWSKKEKHHFDLDGSGVFWNQIKKNAKGKLNTWAIFWYATIYENQGLCLNPTQTYVNNIGEDGSGENCVINPVINISLNLNSNPVYPNKIEESNLAVKRIQEYYRITRGTLLFRAYRHFKTKLIKLLN